MELEKLNQPLSTVLRNGEPIQKIAAIVIDDLVIAGNTINADGEIVHSNDFSVNESLLTGEPYAVFRSEKREANIFQSFRIGFGCLTSRHT
jgi:Ca2+-transporting ATPase